MSAALVPRAAHVAPISLGGADEPVGSYAPMSIAPPARGRPGSVGAQAVVPIAVGGPENANPPVTMMGIYRVVSCTWVSVLAGL